MVVGNTAVIPVMRGNRPGSSKHWMQRFKDICRLADAASDKNPVDLIYVGDSIVEKFQGAGKYVWEYYYSPRHALNIGISGDRTEHVLWRLENGNIKGISPKLAIVMIGQNNGPYNTGDEIAEGVIAIIDTLHMQLPKTKVLLLAIFQRWKNPTDERAVLDRANSILAKRYTSRSTNFVTFLDVNYVFLRDDKTIPAELMPDFEHPSALGFKLWAEAIEPAVAKLMQDQPKPPMGAGNENKLTTMQPTFHPTAQDYSFKIHKLEKSSSKSKGLKGNDRPYKKSSLESDVDKIGAKIFHSKKSFLDEDSETPLSPMLQPTYSPVFIDLFYPLAKSDSEVVIVSAKQKVNESTSFSIQPFFLVLQLFFLFIFTLISSCIFFRIILRYVKTHWNSSSYLNTAALN